MSTLTKDELKKLSIMYEGDKGRDASDKIKGFLFQDYVAIMCLLQDKTEYVCLEYLEDVDVLLEDGTFEIIQVKYYPKKSPDKKEILTDLYYQFLRFQMLHSTLQVQPKLFIYRNSNVKKTTINDLKKYIGIGDKLPKLVEYPNAYDSGIWLREHIYTTDKKEEQKTRLFAEMASEQSIKAFIEKYEFSHQSDINSYKEKLMDELNNVYPNTEKNRDDEHWKLILMGLAILYIQRRYMLVNPQFEQLRVEKKEFAQYMIESVQTKTEKTIVSYLVGIACDEYTNIIDNNDLSLLQKQLLDLIYQKTIVWINEIAKTVDGQFQLLNTFSMDDEKKIYTYKDLLLADRFIYIAECKQTFIVFLDYLWKIMLNICQERIKKGSEISSNLMLVDPTHYIVSSVAEYICLDFPEDKFVSHSVILPPAGRKFEINRRKVVERIVKMSPRPGKWFFENSGLKYGKNFYDYSTANVIENPTVVDLGRESFYVECMGCIGIDKDEWNKLDNCSNCIFSEKCVKEE